MRVGRRLERVLLAGFSAAERAEITSDLRELAADYGGVRGRVYYATELAKYPLRQLMDVLARPFAASGRNDRRGRNDGTDLNGGRGQNGGGGGMETLWKDSRYAIRARHRDRLR